MEAMPSVSYVYLLTNMRKSQRQESQRILHEIRRQSLDTLGRSNENKRGPKTEVQLTQAEIDWQRAKYNMRRANRQSDALY